MRVAGWMIGAAVVAAAPMAHAGAARATLAISVTVQRSCAVGPAVESGARLDCAPPTPGAGLAGATSASATSSTSAIPADVRVSNRRIDIAF